ncbi:MAG: ABC transporter permease, partial [Mesorhizobium sp.]
MNWLKPSWQAVLAIVLCLIAVALGAMSRPEAAALADPTASINYPYLGTKGLMLGLAVVAALISMVRIPSVAEAVVLFIGAHLVAWLLISG